MDDRTRFDEACNAVGVGRRFNVDDPSDGPGFPVYDRVRSIAMDFIRSAHLHVPKLPRIHFGFVDSPLVNAYALKYEGEYFIAVTAGAIVMLNLVFTRIMANPRTLLRIGDANSERSDLPTIPWAELNAEKLYEAGVRPAAPRDNKRFTYAQYVSDQAVMFLVGHEIAHVTRGHVDYLSQHANVSLLSEVGWEGAGEQRITRQAIEIDADWRSIDARCGSNYLTTKHNKGVVPEWSDKPLSVDDTQFDWAFAVNVLFRLFGDEVFTGADLQAHSYPPLALRRRLALDFAANTLLRKLGGEHRAMISRLLTDSVEETEKAFFEIGAGKSGGGFQTAFGEEATKHTDMIRQRRKELLHTLRPHSYESLHTGELI